MMTVPPTLRRTVLLVAALLTAAAAVASAFVPPAARGGMAEAVRRSPGAPTGLNGIAQRVPLIGRFRRKAEVTQVPPIKAGDPLPRDVDVIPGGTGGTPAKIQEVLSAKSLIVGMPGAFTTTCTKEHLPGFRDSINEFQKLGYETVAVVTTNDRWVNEEWMDTVMGGAPASSATGAADGEKGGFEKRPFVILSDADGDFVKSLGLADDMGFGVGVRSKRFAVAVDDGVVTHVITDEGMDDCSATSAKAVLKALAPKGVAVNGEENGSLGGGAAILVGIVAVGAAIYMGGSSMFLGENTSPISARSQLPTTRVQKAPAMRSNKDSSEFSLLQKFKP